MRTEQHPWYFRMQPFCFELIVRLLCGRTQTVIFYSLCLSRAVLQNGFSLCFAMLPELAPTAPAAAKATKYLNSFRA